MKQADSGELWGSGEVRTDRWLPYGARSGEGPPPSRSPWARTAPRQRCTAPPIRGNAPKWDTPGPGTGTGPRPGTPSG